MQLAQLHALPLHMAGTSLYDLYFSSQIILVKKKTNLFQGSLFNIFFHVRNRTYEANPRLYQTSIGVLFCII